MDLDKRIDYFLKDDKSPSCKDVETLAGNLREELLVRKGYKPKEQDCMEMEITLFIILNAEKFLVPKFRWEEN
jgi:hypothetical protein